MQSFVKDTRCASVVELRFRSLSITISARYQLTDLRPLLPSVEEWPYQDIDILFISDFLFEIFTTMNKK